MKNIFWIVSFFSLLQAGEITVAVAANVSYAIEPLKKVFEQAHPKTQVRVILGSSGKLTAQITHGAPYDILLSADMKYPKSLYNVGLAIEKPVIYAYGTLALLSTKAGLVSEGLNILLASAVHKIAIANPRTAPYGIAAKEILVHEGVYETLRAKLVYGESISQTLLYTLKATDIGLVAKSLLFAPQMKAYKQGKYWLEMDSTLYTPIAQGMVILKHANTSTEVKAFYTFMLSKEAQAILKSYGYRIK